MRAYAASGEVLLPGSGSAMSSSGSGRRNGRRACAASTRARGSIGSSVVADAPSGAPVGIGTCATASSSATSSSRTKQRVTTPVARRPMRSACSRVMVSSRSATAIPCSSRARDRCALRSTPRAAASSCISGIAGTSGEANTPALSTVQAPPSITPARLALPRRASSARNSAAATGLRAWLASHTNVTCTFVLAPHRAGRHGREPTLVAAREPVRGDCHAAGRPQHA